MNSEKHKKNLLNEWLGGEESLIPTQARGTHVLGSYVKISKPAQRKPEAAAAAAGADSGDTALREPGGPVKLREKRSQTGSWDHLQKQARLPKLRAPFSAEPKQPGPGAVQAKSVPATKRANRSGNSTAR